MKFDLTQEEANEIKAALMGVVRNCAKFYENTQGHPIGYHPVGVDILPEVVKLLTAGDVSEQLGKVEKLLAQFGDLYQTVDNAPF